MNESKPKMDRAARRYTEEQRDASSRRRLAEYVRPDDDGCWIWTGALNWGGYGHMQMSDGTGASKARGAHRISYELHVGPIPDGLHLDHLCRVRACVNPDHLEPVTPKENVWRSPIAPAFLNGIKTHCRRGHEYTDANTYRPPSAPNQRHCRICKDDQTRRTRAADKARRAALASERPSPYVTSAQAAKMVGVQQVTIQSWIRKGYLAPLNPGCKPHLFEPDEILSCAAARRARRTIEGDAA